MLNAATWIKPASYGFDSSNTGRVNQVHYRRYQEQQQQQQQMGVVCWQGNRGLPTCETINHPDR